MKEIELWKSAHVNNKWFKGIRDQLQYIEKLYHFCLGSFSGVSNFFHAQSSAQSSGSGQN
jgi:hypothetical protein